MASGSSRMSCRSTKQPPTFLQTLTVLQGIYECLSWPKWQGSYLVSGSSPTWYPAVPALSTVMFNPLCFATCRRTASPNGDRQIFPDYTNPLQPSSRTTSGSQRQHAPRQTMRTEGSVEVIACQSLIWNRRSEIATKENGISI